MKKIKLEDAFIEFCDTPELNENTKVYYLTPKQNNYPIDVKMNDIDMQLKSELYGSLLKVKDKYDIFEQYIGDKKNLPVFAIKESNESKLFETSKYILGKS